MHISDHADELPRYRDWAPTAMDSKGLGCDDRQDWIVHPCSQTRDSEALYRSNFRCALKSLGGESETVEVHRFGHWGPGWFEIILVHPDRANEVAEVACALADYPVLDDSDFSELEWEEKTMNLPTVESIVEDLKEELADLPITTEVVDGEESSFPEGELDVRLCYDQCSSTLYTGDVGYDSRRWPHCGEAVIHAGMTEEELTAVAEDLLEQIRESLSNE